MLMNIILYLLQLIQQLYQQNCFLINFICKYLPLKQWAFDDSHSPKYQKFKIDQLPLILNVEPWNYLDYIAYLEWRYKNQFKPIKPIRRRSECDIDENCKCPRCNAPSIYLYKNNGSKGQLMCKVCSTKFSPEESRHSSLKLRCPHCMHTLVPKKSRKHFIVHKCVNPKCPYYLKNLKKVDKADLKEDYGKNKYKLHYIYREFTLDFFRMDLNSLPKNASSLRFSKFDSNVMGLCLTMHVNLGMSLRKTKYPPGSSLSPEVLTSFVLPAHNQGVSYAPIRGHAPWKIFLPTTGSFFVFLITDSLPVSALFSGRYLLPSALFSDCPVDSLPIVTCFTYAACRYAVGRLMSPTIFFGS